VPNDPEQQPALTTALMAEVFGIDAMTRSVTAAPALTRRDVYIPHRPVTIGDGSEHRFRAVASTADLDRFESSIDPLGMQEIHSVVPLLHSHNPNRVVGIVESIERTAEAITIEARVDDDETWEEIASGRVAGVSIGFRMLESHVEDGVLFITRFELIEISITPLPAQSHAVIQELRTMSSTTTVGDGRTVTPARVIVPRTEPRTEIVPAGNIVREVSAAAPAIHRRGPMHFSLGSVISARIAGSELVGIEREVCAELQRRSYGPVHGDIRVPAGVFQRRDLSTNVGSGAALSPEQWMQQLLDDVAAARRWGTLSPKLGFTIISTEREVIHIPKRLTVLDATVAAKDADATESDTTFDQDELGPKYVSTHTVVRRSSLRYSDPSADVILTADIKRAMDDRIDDQVLFGSGAGLNIQGLLNQTPAGLTLDRAGTAIVTPDLFALKSLMLNTWKLDDGPSALRFCANPALVDKLRTTSRKAGAADEWFAGVMPFSSGEGTLLDIALVQSGRLALNPGATGGYDLHLVMGAMGIIAYFGGAAIDLLIDPYTLSQQGSVRLTAFVDVNAVARDLAIDSKIANASVA
jgi:HK97 family phage major capsid protein/HK97 family phage prohead protease